jgi:excinuclease ABC subunit A
VLCDACGGRRFTEETCQVTYHGHSIADVLALSVDQAVPLFEAHRDVHRALRLLQDVGLGYLTLGQRSPTLSGGEAQRIKLVTELARTGSQQHTLYVLDEPTIGLHMGDVANLVHVLHRLVEAGGSVIIIEHNLDVIAEADWVIDLGPEGGARGGLVTGVGTPERIGRLKRSHTGRFLARHGRAS